MELIFFKLWASSMVSFCMFLMSKYYSFVLPYSSGSDSAITILGHYIIVVAFMSIVSSLDTPVLKDYVQPIVTSSYSGVLNRTSNHYIDMHFNI